jgi:hypothetical protein
MYCYKKETFIRVSGSLCPIARATCYRALNFRLKSCCHVVSVTRDMVRFGNWIYWTFTLVTTNNYESLTDLHTTKMNVTTAPLSLLRLHSRCLVAAFDGGLPNSPRPQLPASHFSQLQHNRFTVAHDQIFITV